MNIIILGYYDRGNLGDEAYKVTIRSYLPHHYHLTFVCIDDVGPIDFKKFDGIIVGGGDIINNYFYQKLTPILKNFTGFKIALSIGIPFPSLIMPEYFGKFDHVFIRNYEDVRPLQRVIGSQKAHFLPDLAFNLPRPVKVTVNKTKPICGIFLIQNLMRYDFIVTDLTRLVKRILNTYDIVFYLFNTSKNKNENDFEISNKIMNLIGPKHTSQIKIDQNAYDWNQMLHQINNLDFAICARFHSHIFCMLAGVPFISLSSTRKTKSLMAYAELEKYQYSFKLDANGNPVSSDYSDLRGVYKTAQKNQNLLVDRIINFVTHCKFILDNDQVKSLINLFNKTCSVSMHAELFLNQYNNNDNTARLISNMTLGYPDSSYLWGIIDKIDNKIENCIEYSVQYLTGLKEFIKPINSNDKVPLWIDIPEYQSYKNPHRGGWYLAIEELAQHMNKNGILCDMYIDRTFHWCSDYLTYMGKIPYTIPWCGFIHHTTNTSYSDFNVISLFKKKTFIRSLNTCVGLFTLSPSLTTQIKKILLDLRMDIRVKTFVHPIVMPDMYFLVSNFKNQKTKRIVQIGSWLRNYFTIYRLKTSKFEKAVLVGAEMNDIVFDKQFDVLPISSLPVLSTKEDNCIKHPICPCRPDHQQYPKIIQYLIAWLEENKKIIKTVYQGGKLYIECTSSSKEKKIINSIKKMIKTVITINRLNNEEYDFLLSRSIVFLHLVDSAAVNVVIECIIRNTPILINKTPGVCDLLGPHYPLYYDEKKINVDDLLTTKQIEKTHQYLMSMDKNKFSIDYFVNDLGKRIKKIDRHL